MEDETLNNVLNLLQNTSNNNSNNPNNLFTNNNDLQTLLIKFLLSGGLNQILGSRKEEPKAQPEPPKPRTIDLTNYQRLDWTTMLSSTTSISVKWICSVIICSEILSSICVWIKRRIGRTP